ncbi:MAG: response regulator [Deltaproteobacteria bacterium]|nr:response regulator [Deltaproteobacteria bacterium]
MNIRCQKCGVTNGPEKRRCGACGHPITPPQGAPAAQGKPLATSSAYAQPRASRSPLALGAGDERRALTPQGSAPRPAGAGAAPGAPTAPRHPLHPLPPSTPRTPSATPEAPLEPSAGRPPLTYERLLKLTREGEGLALFVFDPPAQEGAAPPRPAHLRALLELTAPRAAASAEEASLCLCLDLPPRSWLQALAALTPDIEVWVWLARWPEGKTGSQLAEGASRVLYFGEEGLCALAADLLRLCPDLAAEAPRGPWWAEARSRAALQEAEAAHALLAAAAGARGGGQGGGQGAPPYALPLCAARARLWARASGAPAWAHLAQALHALTESPASAAGAPSWAQGGGGGQARALAALQCAERAALHELSARPLALPALSVACLTSLQVDAPVLPSLLERLGQRVSWFKHPQAMLNKMGVAQVHWCVLLDKSGLWDGGDLAAAVRRASPHTKVALCLPDPSAAALARAQQLKVDLVLDLRLGEAAAHLALARALAEQGGGGGREVLLRRLGAIEAAQAAQGLPAQGGLLLLRLPGGAPWLPAQLAALEALRAELLPKSLPAHPLAEDTVGLCLAERDEGAARAFVARSLLALGTQHAAGGALFEGASAPEATLLDALARLEWARASGEGACVGVWRGAHAPPGARARGAQALVVDSDPTSADALRVACEREGLLVTTLTSTRAALDLLARLPHPPQLVVAECAPPQCDGLGLLRACAAQGRGAPRVVLSAAPPRDALMREAFELGATDFLAKPLQVSEALPRLLYALRRP